MFCAEFLRALCDVEKFPFGQNRDVQRSRFVELASGFFTADAIIGVLGYRTPGFRSQFLYLRVDSIALLKMSNNMR
jgi:hypothetical protein